MGNKILSIQEEFKTRKQQKASELKDIIYGGFVNEAVSHILFFESPAAWEAEVSALIKDLAGEFGSVSPAVRTSVLKFLLRLSIDLKSNLTGWYLADVLSGNVTGSAADTALAALRSLENDDAAAGVLASLAEVDALRLKAEGLDDTSAAEEIRALCGGSLSGYAETMIGMVNSGNLQDIALKAQKNPSMTILGNDYGDYLLYTMRMGFSFQTTNPPLVKMAWDARLEFWKEQLGNSMADYSLKTDSPEELVMNMTMEVVEYNCRLIRPLFLLTGGRLGYVCYQVSPMNHNNAKGMIAELEAVYSRFQQRFGGEPNVSFKIPGTSAGLEAARVLSPKGFSFTITLSFGAFQTLEFAKVLNTGTALFNAVVVMNGRLAFPVRDELLAMGAAGAEKASEFAGVETTRKIYNKMYSPESAGGLGIEKSKVRIMNASLRIYGTEIPDIAEIWGSPAITVFPNVRRAYDAIERSFTHGTVENSTPAQAMEVLVKSEIFRQAWWVPGDDEALRPARQLTLEKKDADYVIAWQPIAETLKAFIQTYQETADLGKTLV